MHSVDMAPFYKFLCTEHSWKGDVTLLGKMETANAEEIKKLTAAIAGTFAAHSPNLQYCTPA